MATNARFEATNNKIEARPGRARLRDYGGLKSAGRYDMSPHFAATLRPAGLDGFEGEALGPVDDVVPNGSGRS